MNFLFYKTKIDIPGPIREEIHQISKLEDRLNKNRGNYFSKDTNFLKQYPELMDTIFNQVKDFAKDEVLYRESWLNVTGKDQFHHRHSHPNSHLTTILYVNTLENDTIIFHGKENNEDIPIEVNNNEFIIFDSSVWHSVKTNTTDTTRLSIGCDFNYSNTEVVGLIYELLG